MSIKTRELTEDEISILLLLNNCIDIDGLYDHLIDCGAWVLKAIEKRFEAHKIKADKKVMIWVFTIGDCAVGRCAKHVDEIVGEAHKLGFTNIEWNTFVNEMYRDGIPVF